MEFFQERWMKAPGKSTIDESTIDERTKQEMNKARLEYVDELLLKATKLSSQQASAKVPFSPPPEDNVSYLKKDIRIL